MKAETNLKKVLESGKFAVTAEVGPPKSATARVVERKGETIRKYVDAVNVTDNQTAIVRMSSMAGCVILRKMGVDPVLQITCRDRNRIAIQSDVLGAVALGIGNILCLSGDHQTLGNHPGAKGVFEIDSIQLVQALKAMRNEKKFICSEDILGEVPLFIGAVENPFADPQEFRIRRLGKKIKAGADFIQTQVIFDCDRFSQWMKQVVDCGMDKQTHILAGIIPLKSVGIARYIRDRVPGIEIPDQVIRRMENASDAQEEGIKISLEIIENLRGIAGIHGVHLFAVGWEDSVPAIIQRAGLSPRPIV